MTLSVGLPNLTDISTSSLLSVNRDSVTGIAPCYGLDGPGVKTRLERDFPHPSRPSLGPTQLLYNGCGVFFRGVMRPGRGGDHPPTSSAEVKERLEIYLYSSSGPSWTVLRWILTLSSVISLCTYTQTHTHTHTHTRTQTHKYTHANTHTHTRKHTHTHANTHTHAPIDLRGLIDLNAERSLFSAHSEVLVMLLCSYGTCTAHVLATQSQWSRV